MKENLDDRQECLKEILEKNQKRAELPKYIDRIIGLYNRDGRFHHILPESIPSKEAIVDIIGRTLKIIYPGYFTSERLDEVKIQYYFGQKVTELFDTLSEQVTLAIRHDCLRFNRPCVHCEEKGQEIALQFIGAIPEIQLMLSKDVRAAYEGDPASCHFDDIIFCYPGLYAISVYRIAHWLHIHEVPLIPRIMTEYAHSLTGIDIHPGVEIGESFFIDHGTGVVIGETTKIGNRVRIYQGVTLGALSLSKEEVESLRRKKRHPTIEDDVIIYANATILGGNTVIGARSVIGGNVWLTESIPPDTEVFLKKPELIVKKIKDAFK
ncbi:MAG TPA: hypothetical protein PK864_04405 [Syntrophorhabdaceae bacterium]|nr:hypothetical protein [Syntrophorhabdaceae bacterium]HOT42740.1 hypothetical protein [Syntrophorhabdaceae bacterium]HQE80693.1 hypothetical protein [Syntrophorhabdaceae bacterium]HQK46785.1 hypothetical protein [Syntrophorhabdaceae bacterium]